MNSLLLLLLPVAAIVLVFCCLLNRFTAALGLLALSAFCGFGFLASFEPGISFVWAAGYAACGLSAFATSVWLLLSGKRTPSPAN